MLSRSMGKGKNSDRHWKQGKHACIQPFNNSICKVIPPTRTPILVAFLHPPDVSVEALQLDGKATATKIRKLALTKKTKRKV